MPQLDTRIPAQTPRLVFRSICIDDLPLYSALYGDADTMRHIGPPIAKSDAAVNLHDLLDASGAAACGWSLWVLALRSAAGSGDIGIGGLCRTATSGEIGVMLLPGFCNRGLAAEAIRAIRVHAFVVEQLAEVFTSHRATHAHAEQLMRRLDFERQLADGQVRWTCSNDAGPALAVTRPSPSDLQPLSVTGVGP